MMNNSIEPLLVNVLLSSVLLIVSAVVVLLALKYKKYHSRPYLLAGLIFLLQALGIGSFLLVSIINGRVEAPFDTILRPGTLITGFTTYIFILAYIIDIKFPGKLNIKNLLLGISPFLAASAILLMLHSYPIHHPAEVLDNISRPNVLLRLIIVSFYFLYPILVTFIPYEWCQCMASRKMVVWLHILSYILAPAFIAGIICGYFPAVIINYIVAIIFDTLIVYIEFKIRIPISEPLQDNVAGKQCDNSILERSDIWMNPDLTVGELATMMGTNHKYLLKKIRDLGYSSYSDMVNSKRIEYICQELEKGTNTDIISLMFEAGFRSRSTASREFKRIKGCSPSEYITRR